MVQWKNGELSNQEYIAEILKSGGDTGLTAAATAGIMTPISAAVTAAGMTTIVTIPVAIAVSAAVNKVIAPCFGRGQYKKILEKAQYYRRLEKCYDSFIETAAMSASQLTNYVITMQEQAQLHENMKSLSVGLDKIDAKLTEDLKNLYDAI